MANLTAKFRLVDEMSAKLDRIAQSGRNALSSWERAGTAIDSAFDGAASGTATAAQSIDEAGDAIDSYNSQADRAAAAVDNLDDSTARASADTEEFTRSSRQAEDALDDVAEDAERAGDGVEDFGDEAEEAGKKSKKFGDDAGNAIESVEQLLVAAGIVKLLKAIGDGFVDCVKDAIEFESAITGVYKTVDGTPEQLAAISDEVKEMSLRLPSTTTEIAAVAEAAGQLGIKTDNITDFTEVMINLGEATNLTSDEAASSLAKFANITKMSATDYENLGSTVVALGNNFATTEADIVAMSTRMASAGTLAGMTESDILALAASLSSVGVEADAGGSSMSQLISRMQLAVETGNDQLEQFASVSNMTVEEFKTQWGNNAIDALYAFIAGLNDAERNGASATAVLDEMGITEIRLSNAVKSLANNHEGLGAAIDLASSAWTKNTALSKEAETRYSTLESKLAMTQNSATNLSTAVGEVFAPAVEAGAGAVTNMLNGLTGFVKEHPTVVKAVAAVTVAVAAFTAGIVAFTVAKKVATVAQAAFNAVAYANPYVLLAMAIVGVTAGLAVFIASTVAATEEEEKLSYTSQVQKDKLSALNNEYKEVCATYGETSYQAQELAWEIEELTDEYENSKQTMEEWVAEFDEAMSSYQEFAEQRDKAISATELENEKILNLVTRLDTLASQTELSAGEQQEMLTIIKALNEQVPELSLSYDQYTKSLSLTADAILAIAEAAANQSKYDTLEDELEKSILKRTELTNALDEAETQYTSTLQKQAEAQAALDAMEGQRQQMIKESQGVGDEASGRRYASKWQGFATQYNNASAALGKVNKEVDTARGRMNDAERAIEDNENAITRMSEEMAKLTGTVIESSDGLVSYEKAVTASVASVKDEIQELCEKYDEAYEAARDSIDSQIGLFQEIKVEVKTSVEEMMGAMESQVLYLESYTANLKKALDFGFDKSLVEQLSDGSTESAAYLDTIISKVEDLGGTTDAAKKFVDGFNDKFGEVEKAKDEFAGQVADMETDFSTKMDEIEERLNAGIDAMNMESDAAAAAKATMAGYIAEIVAGGNAAVEAAADAAKRVSEALATGTATTARTSSSWTSYDDAAAAGYSNIRTRGEFARGGDDKEKYGTYQAYLDAMYNKYARSYTGYAVGTTSAVGGLALVGERGPELVDFNGGERVYTASDTRDMLTHKPFYAPDDTSGDERTPKANSNSEKTIRLEINGSGSIDIDKSLDEESIVGIIYNHLKPVLTSIVKQEIIEEGDLAYDF